MNEVPGSTRPPGEGLGELLVAAVAIEDGLLASCASCAARVADRPLP